MNHGQTLKRAAEYVFYGNYFYGLCAMALMAETTALFDLEIRDPAVFVLAGLATVLFYNYPYRKQAKGSKMEPRPHLRTAWYRANERTLQTSNRILFGVFLLVLIRCILVYGDALLGLSWPLLLIAAAFPLTAWGYYGYRRRRQSISLRQYGRAKPFIIGFVWTGLVNVYPLIFAMGILGQNIPLDFFLLLQFCKSLMYISILAMLFDIKDYATDKKQHLKTAIVRIGIRKVLFNLIFPLCALGLGMFFLYAWVENFSPLRAALLGIPFILLIATTYSLRRKRTLLYYMIVVDGLMLVKALCGILAVSVSA